MYETPSHDPRTLATSVEAAAIAELVTRDSADAPVIEPVVPLLLDGQPALALTYDRCETAHRLERAPALTLALAEPKLARTGWSPLVVGVRATVDPGPDGELFVEHLLEQELRKHPPSVPLAGSFLLQRENWWYLPRLIVRLEPTGQPQPISRREDRSHGLLAWNPPDADHPEVRTVSVANVSADRIPLGLAQDAPPEGLPATLRLQDFEAPEMERRAALTLRGRVRSGRLEVEQRTGSIGLGKRPGIIARWRSARELERGCKAGIKEGYPPR